MSERSGVVLGVVEFAAPVVPIRGFGGTRMVDMFVGDPLPRIC